MREAKFRFLVIHNSDQTKIPLYYSLDKIVSGEMDEYLRSGRYTILGRWQFTGLKDKNGVEIYEGYVYHHGDPRITYTVVWHDSGLIGKQNGSSSYAGLNSWQDRIEVIGNIYENPELLEVAK